VHVVAAELLNDEKAPRPRIGTRSFCPKLPKTDFANDYAYNRFRAGPLWGIRAKMGAAATVTLAPWPASGTIAGCEVHTADGCRRPDLLRDTQQ